MKTLHKLNKRLVIVTLLLYFTIYLGALFQIVLGSVQILMSLYLVTKFKMFNNDVKTLLSIYLLLTSIILYIIYKGGIENDLQLIVYLIIPMVLAFLHLFITYKISRS